MVKSLEYPKGIPPIEPVECPTADDARQMQILARAQMQEVLTIAEICPVCHEYGTRVNCIAKRKELAGGITKITHFEISITRPCGHAKREFAIGI